MRKLFTLFCLLFLCHVTPQAQVTNGLLSEYLFNGNAQDSQGNNDGTLAGQPELVPDRFNNPESAYRFNGTNSIDIFAPHHPSLYNDAYTYTLWVSVESYPQFDAPFPNAARIILSIGNVGADQAIGLFNTSQSAGFGVISYGAVGTTQKNRNIRGNELPELDRWFFLTVTRDQQSLKLYVDGTLIETVSTDGINPAYATPILGTIGARHAGNSQLQNFKGDIDDVRIYNRVLSQEEINLLYKENTASQFLVSEYLFEGNTLDSQGENHGIIAGHIESVPDRCGKDQGAYYFDGNSNNRIEIRAPFDPELYIEEFTYSAWVKVPSLPPFGTGTNPVNSARMIMNVGNLGADQAIGVFNNYFGLTGFGIISYEDADMPTNDRVSTGILPEVDRWYFITAKRTSEELSLYIDGELIQSVPVSNPKPGYADPKSVVIGGRHPLPNDAARLVQSFVGDIDEVKIYNKALDSKDIQCIYKQAIQECNQINAVLINTETGEVIQNLSPGDVIDIDLLGTDFLSIEALTTAESVAFQLTGPKQVNRTENIYPFTLFGEDEFGVSKGQRFVAGDYTVTITTYSGDNTQGNAGGSIEIPFTIIDELSAPVQAFILINADTEEEIQVIHEGDQIDLNQIGVDRISVRAKMAPGNVGSVLMELISNTLNHTQVENITPFALFGGAPKENYFGRSFCAGNYKVQATAYAGENLSGGSRSPVEVNFEIISGNLAIKDFILVNAETNEDIGPIEEGMQIPHLPGAFAIRAEVGQCVESIKFQLSEEGTNSIFSNTENIAPFALFGDDHGDYKSWSPSPGRYSLSATAYNKDKLTGRSGASKELSFEIIATSTKENAAESPELILYPNPNYLDYLQFNLDTGLQGAVQVYVRDRMGQVLMHQAISEQKAYSLDISTLRSGYYVIEVISETAKYTKVLIRQ